MIFTNIFTIVHLCPKGIPFLDTLLRHLQSPQCYFPPDRDTNGEDDVDVDDVCGDSPVVRTVIVVMMMTMMLMWMVVMVTMVRTDHSKGKPVSHPLGLQQFAHYFGAFMIIDESLI